MLVILDGLHLEEILPVLEKLHHILIHGCHLLDLAFPELVYVDPVHFEAHDLHEDHLENL